MISSRCRDTALGAEPAKPAAPAADAKKSTFSQDASAVIGAAGGAMSAIAAMKPTTGKTVTVKGKTIFQKAEAAPAAPKRSPLPWILSGVGVLTVVGVGVWLIMRNRRKG